MEIVFLTNLYPPHYRGSYELLCAQIAEGFRGSGHDVCVLTHVFALMDIIHSYLIVDICGVAALHSKGLISL